MSDLQQQLIAEIRGIKDPQVLGAMLLLLKTYSSDEIFQVTQNQELSIQKGILDAVEGRSKSHDQLMNELDEWLSSD